MHPIRLVSLSLALAAAFGAPARAQSLLELVQSASEIDSSWQSARAQLDAAEGRAGQARAGLLPSAGLSAGWSVADTQVSRPPVGAHPVTQNLAINASQPLFRPANAIAYRQGQRGIDLARVQLDGATQDLLVRVSQAYFDVLAAQDTLASVRAQKSAVDEQLAFAKRNFEVGTSTITDSREAQARFDLVRAQEIAAENDLRVKLLALEQVSGRSNADPVPLAQPARLPEPTPESVMVWVQTAQTEQPQVRAAAIALDVARLETKKAETGHLPTVDLQAGYSVAHYPRGTITAPSLNSRTTNASVGVALNVPLFAGFAVQNRVRETLALEEKARADLETTRRAIAQTTRAAYFGLESGRGQVDALEAAERSSKSALEANQLGYQVGVRINIDVLNAQSQLFQTQRDLAQARYNVLLGTLKLRQAAGTLGMDDVRKVDDLLVKKAP